VDYVFELDLREDNTKSRTEQEKAQQEQQQRKQNIFYLNLDDFNLFKLRSSIFLIQFPLAITETVILLWSKVIPSSHRKDGLDDFSKQDQEQIQQVRHSIREFVYSLQTNLKHLLEYLTQVRLEQPLKDHYDEINLRSEYIAFRDIFMRNKWINYTPTRVDDFFNYGFERINDSFNLTLDNVIKNLEEKIASVKNLAKATQ